MPLIRINAVGKTPALHASPQSVDHVLANPELSQGPVIVMIPGYKYHPGDRLNCPHQNILALSPKASPSWPGQLGFGNNNVNEGLGIAFGWSACGALWRAKQQAATSGHALARVLRGLHDQSPDRPMHIIAHSLGIEVALEALHHLPAGSVNRVISMTGAGYRQRVHAALDTPAGQACEFFNVTSRENDVFDFMFERFISAPRRGDRAMGYGVNAPNAVTLQLDCLDTLDHLRRLGHRVAPPQRRICHWSAYTRAGILPFYNDLLRHPDMLTLDTIRAGLPRQIAPRWSRLVARPIGNQPLLFAHKPS